MAGHGLPPTQSMREEWRGLSADTRRKALDLLFSRARPGDDEVLTGLRDLGISTELSTWIVEDALAVLLQSQRQVFERRMDAVAQRTPIDYFNRLLLSLAFLLVMLTWLAQDASSMRSGEFPVSLPVATILSFVAWSTFVASFRKWLASLRK